MKTLIALLMASGAHAATITEAAGPAVGTPMALSPSAFTGSGPCGSGLSVIGDGCSVVLKDDPNASHAYGRFAPLGGSWIDSQDLSHVTWNVASDVAFTSLTFALTDAFDQGTAKAFGPGHFNLTVDGTMWEIAARQPNANLYWLEVLFGAPTTYAELVFRTRSNDGWGVSQASLAQVPLPASLALMLGGIAAFAFMRRKGCSAGA